MAGNQVEVRFVRQSPTSPVSKAYQEAFEAMEEMATCVWFLEADCLDIDSHDKRKIYLFENFRGQAFEQVMNSGNRIYGPMCVLQCLRDGQPLPKLDRPVFSLAMSGLIVSCTSVDKPKRDLIYHMVEWMSGTHSKELHKDITHLVAGEVGTKKYSVAANLKINIMDVDWVPKVWDASKTQYCRGDDPELMKYRCPVFRGRVITVSGIESSERADIKELVTKGGGRYTGEMKIKECTHLVIKVPRGQKYEFAKQWGVHIVTPQWLYDCVAAGTNIEEEGYRPEGHGGPAHTTSTPTGARRSTASMSEIPDVSVISMTTANETNMTMMQNSTMLSLRNQTVTGVTQPQPGTARTQPAQKPASTSSVPGAPPTPTLAPQPAMTTQFVDQALAGVDLTRPGGDMFLDGCKIFLSGFKGANLEKLRKIINLGGGTRFNQINESVSHIIIGERIPSHVEQIQNANHRPNVVSIAWLVESYQAGECVDETPHRCLELAPLEPSTPNPKLKKARKSSLNTSKVDLKRMKSSDSISRLSMGDVTVQAPPAGTPQGPPPPAQRGEAMDDLLSQYLPENGPKDTMGESTLIRAAEMGEAANEAAATNQSANQSMTHDGAPTNQGTDDGDVTMDITMNPEDGLASLFHRRSFLILGFDPGDEQKMGELVREVGGRTLPLNTRKVADYALVPLFGCPVTATVGDIATNAWLQICIEQGAVLSLDSDPIFRPIDVDMGASPLDGAVLSVSGYKGTERDVIIHMAKVLGAKVQEFFVNKSKPSKQLQASTHLIVDAPEGSKYTAAKKWKLPAVTKNWIIQSALQSQKLDVDKFLVDYVPEPTATEDETLPGNTSVLQDKPPAAPSEAMDVDPDPRLPLSLDHRESQKENRRSGAQGGKAAGTQGGKVEGGRAATDRAPPTETTRPRPTLGSTPKLVNQRVRELVAETKAETPKAQKSPVSGLAGLTTDGKFRDPNNSFHANFDLTDAMAALQSPATPATPRGTKKTRKDSLSLEEVFSHHLALGVKNRDTGAGFAQPSTPFSQRYRDCRESQEEEVENGPLHGVVIAVSKKLSTNQSEYNNIAAALGADYRWTYDRSCTHFIFQGRLNDANKEFRMAKEQGKIIVSAHWLLMCQEQSCRVDESLFPHTYNPNMSLTVTPARSTRRTTRASRLTRSKQKTSEESSDGETDRQTTDAAPPPRETRMFDSLHSTTQSGEDEGAKVKEEAKETNTQALVNDLQTLMAVTKSYSSRNRRSSRRTDSFSKLDDNDLSSRRSRQSGNTSDDALSRKDRRSSRNSRSSTKPEAATEASQMVEVSWDDPVARQHQQLLAQDLAKNSESFSPEGATDRDRRRSRSPLRDDHHDDEDDNEATRGLEELHDGFKSHPLNPASLVEERVPTPEPPSIAFPLPRPHTVVSPPKPVEPLEEEPQREDEQQEQQPLKFLLSGMAQNERDDYAALVEELGGVVVDSQHYDSSCTHLVVGKPARNEKYLACVSAGKWVLHKSYFEACRQEQAFVEEFPHEWGSEAMASVLRALPPQVVKLAQAAHTWRTQLHDKTSCGAFAGWRVLLLTDKKKADGFRRLLEAGGGQVSNSRPPFGDLDNITHAFIDLAKTKYQVELSPLVEAGIQCLKPEYIAAFLMDQPQPAPHEYYLPEAAQIIRSLGAVPRKRKASEGEAPGTPSKRYKR